jgi:hypothetical protein
MLVEYFWRQVWQEFHGVHEGRLALDHAVDCHVADTETGRVHHTLSRKLMCQPRFEAAHHQDSVAAPALRAALKDDRPQLLRPASNDVLQQWPVSKRVNSSRADKDDATVPVLARDRAGYT